MQVQPITATTQDHLPIADIVEDIVLLKNGGAALVLSSTSLNFSLLSEREQEAILFAYAAFLNSLSFSAQILVRSEKKDIGRYLAFLEEARARQTNPRLSQMMQEYEAFVSATVKKKGVLSKRFFIVIPFSSLELGVKQAVSGIVRKSKQLPYSRSYIIKKAKTTLYPKRDHVLRQTGRLGLKLKQLTTNELIDLFLELYNPAERDKLLSRYKVTALSEVETLVPAGESVTDIIAPRQMEVDFSHLTVDGTLYRTLFVSGYPRFVSAGWLDPIINFDHTLTLSLFIYPVEGKSVLDDLRRKIAEMEAEISTDIQRGRVVNPATQAKLEDALSLQEQLVKGAERFFQFAFYITIPASSLEELENVTKQVQSTLGALLITVRTASLSQEDGLVATLPLGFDPLTITRNMDTSSLATTFPFTSAELSQEEGVMYGINEDNGSLIIFDRFKLENPNATIFGTSGSGKSYFIKLEALRYLMLGAEIIIIDPESEYKALCEAVGGQFISFSFGSPSKINPFDMSALGAQTVQTPGENQLALKLLSLHSLFKVIMGTLAPTEEALLDRALILTYKAKGITPDPETHMKEPPLMEDLYKAFIGMEEPEAANLAARLEKFVKGSFMGIFDQPTTVDITSPFTVFSVRDLEEGLRPIAMFIVLDFIWTRIRRDIKKRLLIVDEAWHLMRFPDSALFLWSIAKRARKYWLGLSTITQDVEDFLSQDIGRAIVNNAALRILMKQSPSALDRVGEVFHLSEGEKQLILASDIGEGIFFAGPHHVAMRVVASEKEHGLVTTKPEEVIARDQPIQIPGVGLPAQAGNQVPVAPNQQSANQPVTRNPGPGT